MFLNLADLVSRFIAILIASASTPYNLTIYFPGAQYEVDRRNIIAFGPDYRGRALCEAARTRVLPRLAPGVRLVCVEMEAKRTQ